MSKCPKAGAGLARWRLAKKTGFADRINTLFESWALPLIHCVNLEQSLYTSHCQFLHHYMWLVMLPLWCFVKLTYRMYIHPLRLDKYKNQNKLSVIVINLSHLPLFSTVSYIPNTISLYMCYFSEMLSLSLNAIHRTCLTTTLPSSLPACSEDSWYLASLESLTFDHVSIFIYI